MTKYMNAAADFRKPERQPVLQPQTTGRFMHAPTYSPMENAEFMKTGRMPARPIIAITTTQWTVSGEDSRPWKKIGENGWMVMKIIKNQPQTIIHLKKRFSWNKPRKHATDTATKPKHLSAKPTDIY